MEPDVRAQFILCRTLSHQWRPNGVIERGRFGGPTGPQVLKLTVTCANGCGTTREDFIDPNNGEVVARRYRHPDGYLLQGMDERPARADFRRIFLRQHQSDVVNVGLADYQPRRRREENE